MFPIPKAARLPLWAAARLPLLAAACVPLLCAARPDPADPKAPVPALTYRSPLATYHPYADAPVMPWRESNDKVRERGGWRAYAREGIEPDAVPATAKAASEPMNGGHAGHSGHAAPNPK